MYELACQQDIVKKEIALLEYEVNKLDSSISDSKIYAGSVKDSLVRINSGKVVDYKKKYEVKGRYFAQDDSVNRMADYTKLKKIKY